MDIFSGDGTIISEIINRLLNCRGIKDLYIFGEPEGELDYLYPAVRVFKGYVPGEMTGDVVYMHIRSREELERILPWVREEEGVKDFILYIAPGVEMSREDMASLGEPHCIDKFSGLEGILFLAGKSFRGPGVLKIPETFQVLAVIHFYNEADILEQTIQYLLGQDVDIYLLDNWSDDGGYEIAQKYYEAYPGRIYLERFPASGKSDDYEWYNQLEKTEIISRELDYDWFIHYDADEMRVCPWEEITLREAIFQVDSQGYNCIENTVTDFRITARDEGNIFMEDTFFDFRHQKKLFDQLKTWKKSGKIDLKSSAGHFAHVEDPKIFPLKFLNRHYPLRSMEQAEKKVFRDRMPRFRKERGERGWHGHYDRFRKAEDFIFDGSGLLSWQTNTFRELYIPLFLECGIRWDVNRNLKKLEMPSIENRKVILYGAGNIGRRVYPKLGRKNHIAAWVDKQYGQLPAMFCEKIVSPKEIPRVDYDYVVVALKDDGVVQEVREELTKQYGVPEEKILYAGTGAGFRTPKVETGRVEEQA